VTGILSIMAIMQDLHAQGRHIRHSKAGAYIVQTVGGGKEARALGRGVEGVCGIGSFDGVEE
jgi:hypothetical protein